MQINTYLRKTKNLVRLLFPVLPCVENQLYGFYSRVEVFPRKASRKFPGQRTLCERIRPRLEPFRPDSFPGVFMREVVETGNNNYPQGVPRLYKTFSTLEIMCGILESTVTTQ